MFGDYEERQELDAMVSGNAAKQPRITFPAKTNSASGRANTPLCELTQKACETQVTEHNLLVTMKDDDSRKCNSLQV